LKQATGATLMTKHFENIRAKLNNYDVDDETRQEIQFLLEVISIYYGAMVTRDPEKVLEAIVKVKELDNL
jgi:hypothetical protein